MQHREGDPPCTQQEPPATQSVNQATTVQEAANARRTPAPENGTGLSERDADMLLLLAAAPARSHAGLRPFLTARLDSTGIPTPLDFVIRCRSGAFGDVFATAADGVVTAADELDVVTDDARIARAVIDTVLTERTFTDAHREVVRILDCLPATLFPITPNRDPVPPYELPVPFREVETGTVLCWRDGLWQIQGDPAAAVQISRDRYEHRMRYPYIHAWGIDLGSFEYFRNWRAEIAAEDGVPEDVIYYNDFDQIAERERHDALAAEREGVAVVLRRDGQPWRVWYRVNGIGRDEVRDAVTRMAERLANGLPAHA
jgi:hypothetical protein